jgi:prepilin-type N-terminal cleavage/methylation domain-containing protein
MMRARSHEQGFTFIELSIVLTIVGLIVGGVLVGQSLLGAAAVRAQISQIEKYQAAVNTFKGKYGYLPGDIRDPDASSFGFAARGQYPGEGDGNGILEGVIANANAWNYHQGIAQGTGETAMFWVDLTKAGLIEGGFATASSNVVVPISSVTETTTPSLDAYFPNAKLSKGIYVYVWSGGITFNGNNVDSGDQTNYYGLAPISSMTGGSGGGMIATTPPAMTVAQAYNIDMKIDDGFPASGNVTATYVRTNWPEWSAGSSWNGYQGAWPGTSASSSAYTCFDNGGNATKVMQYSMSQNGGAGLNCSLSFRFQ